MSDAAQPESFAALYQRAGERKGGPQALKSLLHNPLSAGELAQIGNDRFLAAFSKKIFQLGFDLDKVLLMPDEMLERKAADPAIIRNYKKVRTIRDNALMIDSIRRMRGNFGDFVTDWPTEDTIGLWAWLKQHDVRLGVNTAPYALRTLGKETLYSAATWKPIFASVSLSTADSPANAAWKKSSRCLTNCSRKVTAHWLKSARSSPLAQGIIMLSDIALVINRTRFRSEYINILCALRVCG